MKKTLYNFFELTIFALLAFFAVILAVGGDYSSAVLEGIKLWIACVLPSLFPYFFITAVLSSLSVTGKLTKFLSPLTTKVFNLNGAVGYAFFMSLISGYPVGATLVSDLRQNGIISKTEAVRASALCSTSSPMFLLGSVGSLMFNSPAFGLGLFICHILSVLSVGFIFSFYKRKDKPTIQRAFTPKKVDNVLYESVYSSVVSSLTVGGLITIFYLITEILLSLGVFKLPVNLLTPLVGSEHYSSGLILGLFECTRGLKALSLGGIGFLALPLATFICSFGGLSVIMQSLAFLKKAKIKTAPFFLSKALSAVLGFVYALAYTLIFF